MGGGSLKSHLLMREKFCNIYLHPLSDSDMWDGCGSFRWGLLTFHSRPTQPPICSTLAVKTTYHNLLVHSSQLNILHLRKATMISHSLKALCSNSMHNLLLLPSQWAHWLPVWASHCSEPSATHRRLSVLSKWPWFTLPPWMLSLWQT